MSEDKNQETQKMVSEQGGVEGQRKEVNVEDYTKAGSIGQILKDMEFPADKNKILQYVQQRQSASADNHENKDILSKLQNMEDKQYQNVSEVTKAAGLVY